MFVFLVFEDAELAGAPGGGKLIGGLFVDELFEEDVDIELAEFAIDGFLVAAGVGRFGGFDFRGFLLVEVEFRVDNFAGAEGRMAEDFGEARIA